jgi:hypothetical protein
MAFNAVTNGWHLGSVDTANAAGGVTMGTFVVGKAGVSSAGCILSTREKRSKVLCGRSKAACGMACNATVSGKRVRIWERTDTIVLGSTTMTALATDDILVM